MNKQIFLSFLFAALCAAGSCLILEFQVVGGVGLMFLSIVFWERGRAFEAFKAEEARRVHEAARREENIAKQQADLLARKPGSGRAQSGSVAKQSRLSDLRGPGFKSQ